MARRPKRGTPRYEEEEVEWTGEDLQIGSVAFNDITEARKRPRKLKEKKFPFGFRAPE